jgi:hypothetical protein
VGKDVVAVEEHEAGFRQIVQIEVQRPGPMRPRRGERLVLMQRLGDALRARGGDAEQTAQHQGGEPRPPDLIGARIPHAYEHLPCEDLEKAPIIGRFPRHSRTGHPAGIALASSRGEPD